MSNDVRNASSQLAFWSVILVAMSRSPAMEPDRGPPFPRIANVYGTAFTKDGFSFHGDARTVDEVARYDILIGVQRWHLQDASGALFRQKLQQLKAINPWLIALDFACSAPYTRIAPPENVLDSLPSNVPSPWLLQTNGQPIAGWPGTHMLNLANPVVVEWLAQQTVPATKKIGYDGVFIDCMGPTFDTWACEISTGKPYTVDYDQDGHDDDRQELARVWKGAKTQLALRTRELIGDDAIFMANQAGPDCYEYLNGIYLEDYVDAVLEGRMAWQDLLKKYLHWTQTPSQPNVTVLGCASGVEPPFEAFKTASKEERQAYLDRGRKLNHRMRFGLATALMGDGYYSYDLHTRWRGQFWWYPEFDAPLGYPAGNCQEREDGTWHRRFDGGQVIVNPTNWDTIVRFDDMQQDISSRQIDREFVVPRLDGRVFLPTDRQRDPGEFSAPQPRLTMSGPSGVLERDGLTLLRDGRGMAVMVGSDGTLVGLGVNGEDLIEKMSVTIVSDDRWRNFAAGDVRRSHSSAESILLEGQRVEDDHSLAFTQEIRLADNHLTADYSWRAESSMQLRSFRHAIRFSAAKLGGRTLETDQGKVHLPLDTPAKPNLAHGIKTLQVPGAHGSSLSIQLPQPAMLIDDRCYNGSGYLLMFHPVANEIAQGHTWEYRIKFGRD